MQKPNDAGSTTRLGQLAQVFERRGRIVDRLRLVEALHVAERLLQTFGRVFGELDARNPSRQYSCGTTTT